MFQRKKDTLEKSQNKPAKCQPKFTFKFSGYGSSYLTLTHGRSYLSQREYQATGCWGLFGGGGVGVRMTRVWIYVGWMSVGFPEERLGKKRKLSQAKALKFGENRMTK